MAKADGVLHKYAKIYLPFTKFEGMPLKINKKWSILGNHRDDLMKMTNGDINVELFKHVSDDTYYQDIGARITKILGGRDWEQSFGESMLKKRKDVVKELEEKEEEYEKSRRGANSWHTKEERH